MENGMQYKYSDHVIVEHNYFESALLIQINIFSYCQTFHHRYMLETYTEPMQWFCKYWLYGLCILSNKDNSTVSQIFS